MIVSNPDKWTVLESSALVAIAFVFDVMEDALDVILVSAVDNLVFKSVPFNVIPVEKVFDLKYLDYLII